MISIIITTRNRQCKLSECVESILKNTYTEFELIIIDQSDDKKITQKTIEIFKSPKIKYFSQDCQNVSKGKNLGIRHASGTIIVFTDDDCIVHASWLKQIFLFYSSHKQIACVFGKTLPHQPKKHPNLLCPSVFTNTKIAIIRNPKPHWKYIGIGNNVSFRSSAFKHHGLFKEWLGYGTPCGPSEDAEIALRLLTQKGVIAYSPKPIVYHDNWMTEQSYNSIRTTYYKANIVCYGYFFFQRCAFALPILHNEIMEYLRLYAPLSNKILVFMQVLTSLSLAFYFSLVDPINQS